nr:NADP(+)-dependent isocitrate dehydrogenase, NADP(+)-dependent IDH {peak II} {EC 1.1.1.42} [rats, ovary, Peptide Partial, 15 aa] [Rattus sp.]
DKLGENLKAKLAQAK